MSEALKPCPWCGGPATLFASSDHSTAYEGGCGNMDCPVEPQVWKLTEAEAIAAWNRRAPETSPELAEKVPPVKNPMAEWPWKSSAPEPSGDAEALRLADNLDRLYDAKVPHPSGPHGQMMGAESYRLVTDGIQFSALIDAAATLRRLAASPQVAPKHGCEPNPVDIALRAASYLVAAPAPNPHLWVNPAPHAAAAVAPNFTVHHMTPEQAYSRPALLAAPAPQPSALNERPTMRTQFNARERELLAPPHPGDFGIPKEHWEAAKCYANYLHENQGKAQSSLIADAARVIEWARSKPRKPAQSAFTDGPERQAAYWIEWAEGTAPQPSLDVERERKQ